MEQSADQAFKAGFDFARQIRYPEFRGRIQAIDGQGRPILPVSAETTVKGVWDRAVYNGLTGRCLLALADDEAEGGFRLAVVDFGGPDVQIEDPGECDRER